MPLAHFNNIPTARDNEEPLYSNLFEITFTFPNPLIGFNSELETLMISAGNFTIDTTKDLKREKQFFKYSGRQFLNVNAENSIVDFEIDFNINVKTTGEMTTWNLLKKWYDLAWNSQTGELHYKRDMIGSVTVHVHDRAGKVLRRTEYKNCQLYGIDAQAYKWEGESILGTKAKFISDYFIDSYYDLKAS